VWGKIIKFKKLKFFKGSHVVYQMKVSTSRYRVSYFGAFRGEEQGHQVQKVKVFLKGNHVVYQMKGLDE
jgi:hypothetical protein